jgi:O-antigen ligase
VNLIVHNYGAMEGKSIHNLFLQVGADYGLQGMVGLLIFYLGGMWETIRMSQTAVARRLVWPMVFSYMCVTSTAGFLMSSVFIGIESVEAPYLVTLLGLCTACYVDRLTHLEAGIDPAALPELEQVPPPGFEPASIPGLAVARA